jgi:hypothetical protein
LRQQVHAATEALAAADGPHLVRQAPPGPPPGYADLLWQLVKALGFAAPAEGEPDAEAFEAAADAAADAATEARQLQAAGRPALAASVRVEDRAILWMEEVGSLGRVQFSYAPADADRTLRTLQIAVTAEPGQPLVQVLGADRGAVPVARPATAADVLEIGAALERIAEVVARLTTEPAADGIPVPSAGTPGATVTCELCGRTAPAAQARMVDVGPGARPAVACSVAHARALYAGEGHTDAAGTPP